MSKKDVLKEDIATYRACILLVTTSLFGVIGYAVINIGKLTTTQIVLGATISVFLCCSFAFLLRKYLQTRKNLEDIE